MRASFVASVVQAFDRRGCRCDCDQPCFRHCDNITRPENRARCVPHCWTNPHFRPTTATTISSLVVTVCTFCAHDFCVCIATNADCSLRIPTCVVARLRSFCTGRSCSTCHVTDVWTQKDIGQKSKLEASLASHDSMFVVIKGS